jgi:hypothetical protein
LKEAAHGFARPAAAAYGRLSQQDGEVQVRREFLALVALVVAFAMAAQTTLTPDQLLQRGRQFYRDAKYPDAIDDLRAASAAALSPVERQKYVSSGTLDTIPTLEESLVYLALAYAKIGRDNEARDAVNRLLNAERIKPTYASLALAADAAEFEPLAARLAPSIAIPHNEHMQTAAAEASPSMGVQPTLAQEREEMLRAVDERVAAARAEIEAAANAKIADAQRAADERVAAERAAAQKAADEKITAERVSLEAQTEARIAAERQAAEKAATERITASEVEQRRKLLLALREAETYALAGQLNDANRVYNAIAQNPNANRESIAAAATGLYRTSDFPDAVIAFKHLGAFAHGEEDLRYYNAVSLYETGRYDEAKKEMTCALPYLQQTEDVRRYKAKIEQSATKQAEK